MYITRFLSAVLTIRADLRCPACQLAMGRTIIENVYHATIWHAGDTEISRQMGKVRYAARRAQLAQLAADTGANDLLGMYINRTIVILTILSVILALSLAYLAVWR